jgi:molybdopterin/thiamine biosynthesis adenylyltransferase
VDDQSLLRYSRHILLDAMGVEAQEKLARSRVLVVGAGGLGAAAIPYLVSAGIGHILIADGDTVDLTNLQRQIIHSEARVGMNKAASAQQFAAGLNSTVEVQALPERLSAETLNKLVSAVDLVIDCSDNFATRHAINRACVEQRRMLVSGAAIRFDGQLVAFDLTRDQGPCYACLFSETGLEAEANEDRCGVMGVFAPLVGVIGAAQAGDAIRLLCGVGEPPSGRLRLFNALDGRWRDVRFSQDAACTVCGAVTLSDGHSTESQKERRYA